MEDSLQQLRRDAQVRGLDPQYLNRSGDLHPAAQSRAGINGGGVLPQAAIAGSDSANSPPTCSLYHHAEAGVPPDAGGLPGSTPGLGEGPRSSPRSKKMGRLRQEHWPMPDPTEYSLPLRDRGHGLRLLCTPPPSAMDGCARNKPGTGVHVADSGVSAAR